MSSSEPVWGEPPCDLCGADRSYGGYRFVAVTRMHATVPGLSRFKVNLCQEHAERELRNERAGAQAEG